jgi:hypothetical protein
MTPKLVYPIRNSLDTLPELDKKYLKAIDDLKQDKFHAGLRN